jgi:hypothetical protein
METESETDSRATDLPGDEASAARRADRWASEAPAGGRNWWVVVGAILVLAAYGLAAAVVSAARGTVDLSDDLGKLLLGLTPALAALGAVFGFIGTRRSTLRGLGWVVFVVGLLLVLATIAGIVWLMLVLRSFDSG